MPFKKGVKVENQGRKKGSGGGQVKARFIREWARIFRQEGKGILKNLAKEQPLEFCKLGISLFPKTEESNNGGINIVIQTPSKIDEL